MKRKMQGIVIMITIGILTISSVAFAKQITETIDVAYNNIRIVINGTEFMPTDVNGNVVEPFIYNGTTYVPIRAISQALDKDVIWDGNSNTVIIFDKTNTEKHGLPAVEVKDSYISPTEGVDIDVATELITDFLAGNDVKGDIGSRIKVEEITLEQAWGNNKMQLYSVELDYAWLYGVAVISAGNVVAVLPGMPTESIFLADINSDDKYEVCTNILVGSGEIDRRVLVFDVQNQKTYELSARMETDFYLAINETNDLVVYGKPHHSSITKTQQEYLGKLLLRDGQLMVIDD